MNKQLGAQTSRLYSQFYNMELAVAKIQENLQALNALQIIAPITSTANTTTSTSNTLFG
jgi:hypothetical protein